MRTLYVLALAWAAAATESTDQESPPAAPNEAAHNCFTREIWTAEKTAWCCEHKKLGCKDVQTPAEQKEKKPVTPPVDEKKPVGHNCFTREIWTAEKTAWCCEHKKLGCKDVQTPAEQKEKKPVTPPVDEKKPVGHNCFTREIWTAEKTAWCCEHKKLGCKDVQTPAEQKEKKPVTPPVAEKKPVTPPVDEKKPVGHNCFTLEIWTAEKTAWCCEHKKLGCKDVQTPAEQKEKKPVTPPVAEKKPVGHNCFTREIWTAEKTAWCCEHKKLGCKDVQTPAEQKEKKPVTPPVDEKKPVGHNCFTLEIWTAEKTAWCCEHKKLGCKDVQTPAEQKEKKPVTPPVAEKKPVGHNCFTREIWTAEKTAWCCEHKKLGCKDVQTPAEQKEKKPVTPPVAEKKPVGHNCFTREIWTAEKTAWCCEHKKLGCKDVQTPAEQKEKKPVTPPVAEKKPVTPPVDEKKPVGHNCFTREIWTAEKTAWCCEHKKLGCKDVQTPAEQKEKKPVTPPVAEKKPVGHNCFTREIWTAEKTAWCCEHKKLGCKDVQTPAEQKEKKPVTPPVDEKKPVGHNCFTLEIWTAEKTAWCCEHKKLGCKDVQTPAEQKEKKPVTPPVAEKKPVGHNCFTREIWTAEKTAWCCEHKKLGCKDVQTPAEQKEKKPVTPPVAEKKPVTPPVAEKKPVGHNCFTREIWTAEKTAWCCEHKKLGCKDVQTPAEQKEKKPVTPPVDEKKPVGHNCFTLEIWTAEKTAWCCEHKKLGCKDVQTPAEQKEKKPVTPPVAEKKPVTPPVDEKKPVGHNCFTLEIWTAEKTAWCCEHKKLGCKDVQTPAEQKEKKPVTPPVAEKKPVGHNCFTREIWTAEGAEDCLVPAEQKEKKPVTPPVAEKKPVGHNCFTREIWTAEKTAWCCEHKKLGCKDVQTPAEQKEKKPVTPPVDEKKPVGHNCFTLEIWTAEKTAWCCEHKKLGCKDVQTPAEQKEKKPVTPPVAEKKPVTPPVDEKKPVGHNCFTLEIWTAEKTAWCCEHKKLGCKDVQTPAEQKEKKPVTPPVAEKKPVGHNCFTREIWTAEKTAWCCEHKKLGCKDVQTPAEQKEKKPVTPPVDEKKPVGHNCFTREIWTAEKTAWCCEHKKLGCTDVQTPAEQKEKKPVTPPVAEKKPVGHNCFTREIWTAEKTAWCCEHKKLGCKDVQTPAEQKEKKPVTPPVAEKKPVTPPVDEKKPVGHNCFTREIWTAEKTAWCCEHKKLGCKDVQTPAEQKEKKPVTPPVDEKKPVGHNCFTREIWTAEKTAWCCEHKKLGCKDVQTPAEQKEKKPVTPPVDEKKPVGHNCFTLEIWTAEKTAWCCEHKKLGCKDVQTPAEQKEKKPVTPPVDEKKPVNETQDPCASIQCQPDQFCTIGAAGAAYCETIQTMIGTQDPCASIQCQPDHFCTVDGAGFAFCEKLQTLRDARVLGGTAGAHVNVAHGVRAPVPVPTGLSSSVSGVAIALGAALGALCLGGLVAFTVMRKRKPAADLVDIEMVTADLHSEKQRAEYSPVQVSRM